MTYQLQKSGRQKSLWGSQKADLETDASIKMESIITIGQRVRAMARELV